MGIQQSLQTINPIQQHHTRLFPPLHQNNTKQSKWPSSSLSSSPPWPLLPSPPPRVLLTRTPRSRSPARTTPPSAATVRRSPAATAARTSLVLTASASPFSRLAVPTSLLAARPAMLRATSSTSRPTASPSPFKRFRLEHGQRSSLLLVVIDRPLPQFSLLSGHVFYFGVLLLSSL